MLTSPDGSSSSPLVQASVFSPSMFIAHEPHTPSRQERRSVSVGSISFLIFSNTSRTIAEPVTSTSKVSTRGLPPTSGSQRYTLKLRTFLAPGLAAKRLPFCTFDICGNVNSAIFRSVLVKLFERGKSLATLAASRAFGAANSQESASLWLFSYLLAGRAAPD